MIDTLQLYNELKETLDSSAAEKIAKTIGLVYDELQVVATKSKSNGLERQAEFQNQTKHMSGLEAALEQLAIAQAKTEVAMRQTNNRMDRVEASIDRLAEAQAKTEATVEQTNIRIDRLTEALEQTNNRIDRQNKQLGGLSNAIGGDIEDIAYIVLHKVLKREFGWQVGVLKRMWQNWSEQPEEVDIMGQTVDPTRPKETIWIVGEAKHNMTEKGVRRFIKQLERARLHLDGEIFPVCFCYRVRPEVREMIVEANIRLVYSYGELV